LKITSLFGNEFLAEGIIRIDCYNETIYT